MKSVKVKQIAEQEDNRPLLSYSGGQYGSTLVGYNLLSDLGIVAGSTIICLPPGESLPEAGWTSLRRETVTGKHPIIFGFHAAGCAFVGECSDGDTVEVRVKRAPKPKAAVLWVRGWTTPTTRGTGWICGGRLDNGRPCGMSFGGAEPKGCSNCGSHFTETKEL